MAVLGNLIVGLVIVLDFALSAYTWVIIASAVLSWVRPDPYAPVVRFIYSLTDPVIYWIKRRIPTVIGGLDLSPIVLILAIMAVRRWVLPAIAMWAKHL